MKKLIFAALAAFCLLASCKEKEYPWSKDQDINSGVFEFLEKQTVIEVTSQTKSIKIRGKYLKSPDKKMYGKVSLNLLPSTAEQGVHFDGIDDQKGCLFLNNNDKTLYHEIVIYPEKITEELHIALRSSLWTPDTEKFPDMIRETTIILRPTVK